jgi:hypothetical protein
MSVAENIKIKEKENKKCPAQQEITKIHRSLYS